MGHCLGGQWGLCLHGPHGGWLGSEGGGGGTGATECRPQLWHCSHCVARNALCYAYACHAERVLVLCRSDSRGSTRVNASS